MTNKRKLPNEREEPATAALNKLDLSHSSPRSRRPAPADGKNPIDFPAIEWVSDNSASLTIPPLLFPSLSASSCQTGRVMVRSKAQSQLMSLGYENTKPLALPVSLLSLPSDTSQIPLHKLKPRKKKARTVNKGGINAKAAFERAPSPKMTLMSLTVDHLIP